jgi:GAF domain-containing protein
MASALIAHVGVNNYPNVTELIQRTFHYYESYFHCRMPACVSDKRHGRRKGKRKAKVALDVEIGQGLIGEAAASGERVLVDDVRNDPRYRFIDVLPETRSEVVLPLKIEGLVLGVLDVQSDQVNGFHPNDLLILEALADTISRAVEGARLYSDLRRRANQLTLIAEVSKSVSASWTCSN